MRCLKWWARIEYRCATLKSSLRPADLALKPETIQSMLQQGAPYRRMRHKGGILVVGVDSLMTQLANAAKPAPPDEIGGFVTRGEGVSVHRS